VHVCTPLHTSRQARVHKLCASRRHVTKISSGLWLISDHRPATHHSPLTTHQLTSGQPPIAQSIFRWTPNGPGNSVGYSVYFSTGHEHASTSRSLERAHFVTRRHDLSHHAGTSRCGRCLRVECRRGPSSDISRGLADNFLHANIMKMHVHA
jgi:hypothetical protein